MQTFLPYPDYSRSAKSLDRQRLGKQRVECLQLLKALNSQTKGWVNHPCCVMWRGSEFELLLYGQAVCAEWKQRGYKDTCSEKMEALMVPSWGLQRPRWLGDSGFHRSHQSNLVRKLPSHYRDQFPGVPDDLEYVWPSP